MDTFPTLHPVTCSDAVVAVGYEVEGRTLYVKTSDGQIRAYTGVDFDDFVELCLAPSKFDFVLKRVRRPGHVYRAVVWG